MFEPALMVLGFVAGGLVGSVVVAAARALCAWWRGRD